jgi:sarcosine oxidase subunit gamma
VADHGDLPPWTQPGRHGAAGEGIALAEATIATAWNVQGDPGRAAFAAEAARLFGVALPGAPNTLARSATLCAAWIGPRSWLLVAGGDSPLADFAAARDALAAAGGALFDVSFARIAWTVSGPEAATVLAKGCPLDFDAAAFPVGTCAQSLFGHVGALYLRQDRSAFTVMVPRSYARDVWHSLLGAAAQYGVLLRAPAPFA